jgi:hypothetical protein
VIDHDASPVFPDQSGDQIKGGGFAAARRARQYQNFPRINGKIQVRKKISPALFYAPQFKGQGFSSFQSR